MHNLEGWEHVKRRQDSNIDPSDDQSEYGTAIPPPSDVGTMEYIAPRPLEDGSVAGEGGGDVSSSTAPPPSYLNHHRDEQPEHPWRQPHQPYQYHAGHHQQYQIQESLAFPRRADQPPRLMILGATWGGVNVTDDIRALVDAKTQSTLRLDMREIWRSLEPDPMPGFHKILTVLYQYEDQEGIHLLNAREQVATITITADLTANAIPSLEKLDIQDDGKKPDQKREEEEDQEGPLCYPYITTLSSPPWRAGPAVAPGGGPAAEILAVLYGPGRRIQRPSVLQELAKFFEGRRGQMRMTNDFFGADTLPGHKKWWTVYFRFAGSPRVQCVTGMEGGALEVPWGRY